MKFRNVKNKLELVYSDFRSRPFVYLIGIAQILLVAGLTSNILRLDSLLNSYDCRVMVETGLKGVLK